MIIKGKNKFIILAAVIVTLLWGIYGFTYIITSPISGEFEIHQIAQTNNQIASTNDQVASTTTEEVLVTGRVYTFGNEPFIVPGIETKNGMVYKLKKGNLREDKRFINMEGSWIKVKASPVTDGLIVKSYEISAQGEAEKRTLNLLKLESIDAESGDSGKIVKVDLINDSSQFIEIYSTFLIVTTEGQGMTIQYIKSFKYGEESISPTKVIGPGQTFTIVWDVSAKPYEKGQLFKAHGSVIYRVANDPEPWLYDDKIKFEGSWR